MLHGDTWYGLARPSGGCRSCNDSCVCPWRSSNRPVVPYRRCVCSVLCSFIDLTCLCSCCAVRSAARGRTTCPATRRCAAATACSRATRPASVRAKPLTCCKCDLPPCDVLLTRPMSMTFLHTARPLRPSLQATRALRQRFRPMLASAAAAWRSLPQAAASSRATTVRAHIFLCIRIVGRCELLALRFALS